MTGTDDDRVPGRGTERPGRRRRGGARRPAAGMRWSIARLALAVTSMVALAFAVPLGMLAQHVARDRAISDARAQAASLVAVLAVTKRRTALAHAIAATAPGSAGRLAVDLPGQPPVGHPHARGADVAVARYRRESVTADAAHGLTYLQPVVLSGDRTAVIEVYLPAGQLTRGVWTAWLAIAAVVVLLVAGSVLVADHDRHVEVVGAERRLLVPVSRDELIAAVDSLLGNVFEHTPQGTPFRVTVTDTALVVEDAGPGIADPAAALRRGVSGTGSTGVGLPIVRRVADALGGTVGIDRGDLGGARVTLTLGPAGTPAPVPHRRGRRGR